MAVPALGLAAACGASLLFDASIAMQALEARVAPRDEALRPSLLAGLARRRTWLMGTGLGVLGWPLQVTALLLAPIALVQPALAAGLLVLLAVAMRVLGEHAGPREWCGVGAIVAGVAGIAASSPERSSVDGSAADLVLALAPLALLALAPYIAGRGARAAGVLAMLGAGAAFAWTGLSSKLLSDALSRGAAESAVVWALATAAVAGVGLLSEMSALQRLPATRVAPVVYSVQVVAPVLSAPLIGESWGSTPVEALALWLCVAVVTTGTALLASSLPVARIIAAGTQELPGRDRAEPVGAAVGGERVE
jgi:drug/metabolite transporter (DMT)-like permease